MGEMPKVYYSIQEVSQRLDLTHRSLHYWEEKLEINIERDKSGNRIYYENDVELLEKVKELKCRGMTMEGIKALLREKGLLPEPTPDNVIVVNEKAMELKEFILNEMREAFSMELQQTNNNIRLAIDKIDAVLGENQKLREEIKVMQKQGEDHFNKVDSLLTAWRNKKPWYKRIFIANA